ncbi:MAG: DUF3883 domain-containing protein, partial [Caldilineaceae bacterium]|nr:DUF3883 domain-containing protein [Caldilineaceae bacterium]
RAAGDAPYLDYRPLTPAERERLRQDPRFADGGAALFDDDLDAAVRNHARVSLAPQHLEEVQARRLALIDKTHQAVRKRLTREINYWDQQAAKYRHQEAEGKRNARLNRQLAEQRADRLEERLQSRERELDEERKLSASPPVIVGRALVVPIGLLLDEVPQALLDTRITEQIAMHAVMQAEIDQGHQPVDVSAENRGYDIESLDVHTGRTRFLEVKGFGTDTRHIEVTHNEVIRALNIKEQFALVLVEVTAGTGGMPRYVWNPPLRDPANFEDAVKINVEKLIGETEGRTR